MKTFLKLNGLRTIIFALMALAVMAGGAPASTIHSGSDATSAPGVQFLQLAPQIGVATPEPATIGLCAVALVGLALRKRK